MGSVIRIASLFSGCGGLDLGLAGGFEFHGRKYEKLPTHVVYANDFDHDAATCFNANMPNFDEGAECHEGDIRDVDESEVPDFDLLLAGFPCQPFSNAGLRGGVNDKYNRGTLFEECERILEGQLARGHKPAAFVFENVRGILSSKMDDGTPVVDEIENRMKNLGYHVGHKLVRASDYGVPQNRFRVLIIGFDANRYKPFLFDELDSVLAAYNLPSQKQGNHEELLLGSLLLDLSKATKRDDEFWAYTEATQTMINQIGPCAHGAKAMELFADGYEIDALPEIVFQGRSWKDIPPELLRPRFRRIYDNPKKYHAPKFFRRFAFGEINGTITASAQPENCGITHPVENRRYTVSEIAAIQSFPLSYDFSCVPLQSRYKVIGNAVPPVLGWVIGKALTKHIEEETIE